MKTPETQALRDHIQSLKGWIAHWKVDAECNLPCTEDSLIMAAYRAEQALKALDQIEADQAGEFAFATTQSSAYERRV